MASSEPAATVEQAANAFTSLSSSKKRTLNGIVSSHNPTDPAPPSGEFNSPSTSPPSATSEPPRRKRKKTRAFEIPGPAPVRRINTGALGLNGRGEKLSTIPNIMYAMEKRHAKAPEIEFLHRLLFNSAGTALKRKANIRAFSGFVFRSEKERSRVRDKLLRSHLNLLKRVAVLLDVQVNERKPPDHNEDKPETEDAAIERAVEAFLGSDSLGSEDLNSKTYGAEDSEGRESVPAGGENSVLSSENGKLASAKEGSKTLQGAVQDLAGNDLEREKLDKHITRQKKEEGSRIAKEDVSYAILSFLELPRKPEGRVNLAQQEKEKKRQRKALEKAKAQKALLKKEEEKRKQLLAKSKARESDEDGDEDLEVEAKPWIVIARERQEQDAPQRNRNKKKASALPNGRS